MQGLFTTKTGCIYTTIDADFDEAIALETLYMEALDRICRIGG